jgi:predicted DNA-binding protein with PD1-like motif
MDATLVHEQNGQRTFVIILEHGEEVLRSLGEFAEVKGIAAAQITAIGALSDVELMYFDWEKKIYEMTPLNEQVEVASLLGDIAVSPEEKPSVERM